MNSLLEKLWNEAAVAQFEALFLQLCGGLRKTMKNIIRTVNIQAKFQTGHHPVFVVRESLWTALPYVHMPAPVPFRITMQVIEC